MSKKKKRKLKVVQVEWIDAASTPGWQKVSESEPVMRIQSIGFLITESRRQLVLALSRAKTLNSAAPYCDVMVIPRGCVKKIKVLFRVKDGYGATR